NNENIPNGATHNRTTPPMVKSKLLPHDIMELILETQTILCTEGRLLIYDQKFGIFNEVGELELSILIRANLTRQENKNLERAKMSDVIYQFYSNPEIQCLPTEFDQNK